MIQSIYANLIALTSAFLHLHCNETLTVAQIRTKVFYTTTFVTPRIVPVVRPCRAPAQKEHEDIRTAFRLAIMKRDLSLEKNAELPAAWSEAEEWAASGNGIRFRLG